MRDVPDHAGWCDISGWAGHFGQINAIYRHSFALAHHATYATAYTRLSTRTRLEPLTARQPFI